MRLLKLAVLVCFTSLSSFGQSPDSTVQKTSPDSNKTLSAQSDTLIEKGAPENLTKTKSITFDSDPGGAIITVDDSTLGVGPVIISLESGTHQVTMKKKGFYLKRAEFVVDSLSISELILTLQQPGNLMIRSEPESASVFMDGQNVGVTPVFEKQRKPGKYQIKLELSGYEPVEQTFDLKSASSDTLNFVLKHTAAYTDSVTSVISKRQLFEKRLHRGIVAGVFLIFGLIVLGMEIKG